MKLISNFQLQTIMSLFTYINRTIFIIVLIVTMPVNAKDKYDYDDCILDHLGSAKLDAASRFIAEACEENYGSGPSKAIMKKERRYNECLLDHMVGVESIDAVIRIRRACEKKYR